ncbi:MAG: hypothetical protein PVS3B1_39010 [Ktedonobacteraceae bacterium]
MRLDETEGAVPAVRPPDPLGEQRASEACWRPKVSGSSVPAGLRSDEVGRLFKWNELCQLNTVRDKLCTLDQARDAEEVLEQER